jgi:molybdopterin converting factor small subunit
MEIEVRLFANLRESHIPEGKINLEDRTTVGELLEKIELSPSKAAVVLINGRHARPEQHLNDGDKVAIFPPIAGG